MESRIVPHKRQIEKENLLARLRAAPAPGRGARRRRRPLGAVGAPRSRVTRGRPRAPGTLGAASCPPRGLAAPLRRVPLRFWKQTSPRGPTSKARARRPETEAPSAGWPAGKKREPLPHNREAEGAGERRGRAEKPVSRRGWAGQRARAPPGSEQAPRSSARGASPQCPRGTTVVGLPV